MSPCLHELQLALGRSLVVGDDAAAGACIRAAGLAPGERLAIHRNTFVLTLVRALRLSYPAVERLVGAEFFEAAARGFIAAEPPRSSWLDDYGAGFAGFLGRFAPAADLPYLADVARLEWAVSRALQADDAEPLDLAVLAAVPADAQASLRFVPHPSLGLLSTRHPADAIWRAVLEEDEAALAALDLSAGPAWLLVQRGPRGVELQRLAEPLWRFVRALCAGQALGAVLAGHRDLDTPAALAALLAEGRLIGFAPAPRTKAPAPSRSPS